MRAGARPRQTAATRPARPPPRLALALVAACLALASPVAAAAPAEDTSAPPRPHIVLILVDDLGWGDIGYHGSDIPTPNLDRLAAAGVRLEQFYTLPGCTPTRASLMTGRYPIRYGMQEGVLWPWTRGGLPLEERTLPSALREVGYRTVMVGKWHLGMSSQEYLPLARGFDHHYGLYSGLIDYYTHVYNGGLDWHRNGQPVWEQGYATNLLGQEAVRIVDAHDPKQPLFLYVAFNAVHAPLQATKKALDRFAAVENPRRRVYTAMVSLLDEAVGQIADAVERRGMSQNTLILFASDNGGSRQHGSINYPLRGTKGTLFEGSLRVPAFATWPGTLPKGATSDELVHVVDWYTTLLTLAGAPLEQPLPTDGYDVWPTLAAQQASPRSQILLNVNRTLGAVRVGPWKLIRSFATPPSIELYDLESDPSERRNVAAGRPEKVEQLLGILDFYRNSAAEPRLYPTEHKPLGFQIPIVWGDPVDETAPRRRLRRPRRRVPAPAGG